MVMTNEELHWSEVDHGDTPATEVIDNELRKRGWAVTDENRTKMITEACLNMERKGLIIRDKDGRNYPPHYKHTLDITGIAKKE
jgi:hypothetical protein